MEPLLPNGARLDELYGRRELEREWNQLLREQAAAEATTEADAEPTAPLASPTPAAEPTAAAGPPPETIEPAAPSDRARAARIALLTPEQRARWETEQTHGQSFGRDLSEESFVRAYLTHPTMHTGNMRATGLGVDFDIPADAMTALRDEVFYTDAAGQERQDAARQLRATAGALEDAIRLMATSGPVGERTEPLAADAYGFDLSRVLGLAVDVFGEGRQPDDALTNSGLYRAIAYRMELGSAAERLARAEGLRGAALDARVGQLEADPTPWMIAETGSGATLRTVNADLLETTGPRLLQWAAQTPGGQLMLPFLAPHPIPGTWFGAEAPVLNETALADRRDMEAGGRAATRARARQAIGQSVAATIMWHVAGGAITGRQEGEGRRLTESPPYSIRRPSGRWVEYPHEPGTVGGLIATLADYGELSTVLPVRASEYEQWGFLAAPLIVATGHVMSDPQALRSVATFLSTIRDGSRHASPQAPTHASQIETASVGDILTDVVVKPAREVGAIVNLAWDHTKALYRGIPAYRDHVTGVPITIPPGWGGPVLGPVAAFWGAAEAQQDVARKELYENRVPVPKVPWVIGPSMPQGGADAPEIDPEDLPDPVPLSAAQRDFWITTATQGYTNSQGRTLKQELEHLLRPESEYWKQSSGPGGMRQVLLRKTLNDFYDAAKNILLADPVVGANLPNDLAASAERKRKLALPRTSPESPQYGMSTGPEDPGRRSPVRELVRGVGRRFTLGR